MATVNPAATNPGPTVWNTYGKPVVTFFQDAVKAFDLTSQQSKGVKEVTKLGLNSLKLANVSPHANIAATHTITFIEALELPQSISYWVNREYKKAEETGVKIAAQVNLLAIRVLVFIKALDKMGVDLLGKASELIGKIPVVGDAFRKFREVTGPYLTIDSVLAAIFLPFAVLSLADNAQTVVKERKKVAHETDNIRFWMASSTDEIRDRLIEKQDKVKATTDIAKKRAKQVKYVAFINADLDKIDLKVVAEIQREKSVLKRKLAVVNITKTAIGAISTTLKAAAAITALVAIIVFGSPVVVGTALTVLALVATSFALSKVLYEGYQSKYQDQYKKEIASPRLHAAAMAA